MSNPYTMIPSAPPLEKHSLENNSLQNNSLENDALENLIKGLNEKHEIDLVPSTSITSDIIIGKHRMLIVHEGSCITFVIQYSDIKDTSIVFSVSTGEKMLRVSTDIPIYIRINSNTSCMVDGTLHKDIDIKLIKNFIWDALLN